MEALHDDILMVVLSHIPNPWGIRARAVCKRWHILLTSASFAKLMASRLYYHNDDEEEEEDDDDDEGNMWLLLYTQKPLSPSHVHIVDPSSHIPPSIPLPAPHATHLVHGQHPLPPVSELDRPIHEPKSSVAVARGPLVNSEFTADDHLLKNRNGSATTTTATGATVVSHEQEDVGYRSAVAALQLGAFGYHPSSHLCMPVPLVLSAHRFHASISAGYTSSNHIHHIISDELLVSSHMGLLVCRRIITSNNDGEGGQQQPRRPPVVGVEPRKCPGIIKELYFEGDPLQLRRPSFGSSSSNNYDSGVNSRHGTSVVGTRRSVVLAPPGLSWISRAGVGPLPVNKKLRGSGSEMGGSKGFQILVLGGVQQEGGHMEDDEEEEEEEENKALLYTSRSGEWEAVPEPPAGMERRRALQYPYSPQLPRSRQSTLVWWKEAFCTLAGDAVYMFTPRTRVWARVRLPSEPRIWDYRFLTIHAVQGGGDHHRLLVEGNFQEQGDFMRRYPLRIGVMELLATTPIPATATATATATSTSTSSPHASMAGPSSSSSSDGGGGGRRAYTYTWSHLGFMPDTLSHGLSGQQPGYPAHSFYTAYSHPRSHLLSFAPSVALDVCCRFCKPQHEAPNLVVFDASSASWNSKPLPPCNHYVLSSHNFKGFTL